MLSCGALWLRPALDVGYSLDDFAQVAMLEGRYPAPRSPLTLFTFAEGTPKDNTALMDDGYFPWWAHPQLRLAMLRPLASALIWADVECFGHDAYYQHLHSLAWWLAMMLAVGGLYLRLLPASAALLSTLLFALDQPQAVALAWLANRNALLSTCFAALALLAYDGFRKGAGKRLGWVSALCYALSLTAGEYGLAAFGLFIAYELCLRRDGLSHRLRALLWPLAPALLFLVARSLGSFGARYSAMYVDPFAAPDRFLVALARRIPILLGEALTNVRADFWSFGSPIVHSLAQAGHLPAKYARDLPFHRHFHEALGVLAMLLLMLAWRYCGRGFLQVQPTEGSPLTQQRSLSSAHMFGIAALLMLVPLVSSMPNNRLLLLPGMGLAPLFASMVLVCIRRLLAPSTGLLARAVSVALLVGIIVVHGPLAALQGRDETVGMAYRNPRLLASALALPLASEPPIADQEVHIVAATDMTQVLYVSLIRGQYGLPVPKHVRVLSSTFYPASLLRLDAHTLELRYPPGASMLVSPVEQMFRDPGIAPLQAGQRVEVPGMSVRVQAAEEGHPTTVRFRFSRHLDDPHLTFLVAAPTGFVRLVLPGIGQHMMIPITDRPVQLPAAAVQRAQHLFHH